MDNSGLLFQQVVVGPGDYVFYGNALGNLTFTLAAIGVLIKYCVVGNESGRNISKVIPCEGGLDYYGYWEECTLADKKIELEARYIVRASEELMVVGGKNGLFAYAELDNFEEVIEGRAVPLPITWVTAPSGGHVYMGVSNYQGGWCLYYVSGSFDLQDPVRIPQYEDADVRMSVLGLSYAVVRVQDDQPGQSWRKTPVQGEFGFIRSLGMFCSVDADGRVVGYEGYNMSPLQYAVVSDTAPIGIYPAYRPRAIKKGSLAAFRYI